MPLNLFKNAGLAASIAMAIGFSAELRADAGKSIDVYRDPNCSCCTKWISYLKDKGYTVNRPGFSRHSPGSLRNAFQTLPVTADC